MRAKYLPFRRGAFLLQALVIVGLPFLRVGGESAFRFDVPTLRLHFFGHTLWMEEFFLFLLGTLWLTFVIVFATVVLGRLWCGWLCPQSALLELADWAGDLLRVPPKKRRLLNHGLLLALSALVSATLIWYFVPPGDFFSILASPPAGSSRSGLVWGFFVGMWGVIYAEVAFLGRRFCATICPYAKLQGALFDRDTLVVEFDRHRREECRGCAFCVKVCPTGMDIKDGLRAECIACARCIDACRSMTEPRGVPSLVRYRWGGWERLGRPAVLLLALAIALLSALTIRQVLARTPLEFTVSREGGSLHTVSRSGVVMNRFRLHLQNKRERPSDVSLGVEPPDNYRILGLSRFRLDAGEDRVVGITLGLETNLFAGGHGVVFVFTDAHDGRTYRREATFFVP